MKIYRSLAIGTIALTGLLTLLAFGAQSTTAKAAEVESLPLCGKCMAPTIFSKSGIGTAHAVAQARITYKDAKGHCESYAMAATPDCDKDAKETLKQENGKIYTATADCVHGKMTDANGENFVYAGLWQAADLPRWASSMKGQTRWRWGAGSDADTGKIVSFDGPTRASMVAATAKLLCPAGVGANRRHR